MMGGLLLVELLLASRAVPPLQDTLYDLDRFLVPASRATELPTLLAQHRHIRLESANYCAACPRESGPRCGTRRRTQTGLCAPPAEKAQPPQPLAEQETENKVQEKWQQARHGRLSQSHRQTQTQQQ